MTNHTVQNIDGNPEQVIKTRMSNLSNKGNIQILNINQINELNEEKNPAEGGKDKSSTDKKAPSRYQS